MCTRMPERMPHVEYLTQVARAAEYAGFDRVLVPCAFSNGNYSLEAPYVDAYTLGDQGRSVPSRGSGAIAAFLRSCHPVCAREG